MPNDVGRHLEEKLCGVQLRLDDIKVSGLISLISRLDNAGQHVSKLNASDCELSTSFVTSVVFTFSVNHVPFCSAVHGQNENGCVVELFHTR